MQGLKTSREEIRDRSWQYERHIEITAFSSCRVGGQVPVFLPSLS
ncbi:hypothetical protein HMPREF9406_1510 [Clostridium sp. HGF2]|nr:hypothetical protein HMPREF9406_1510 [Clostridium sp. HGF2]EQJ58960.1 hypothetical protein QSI_1588 [Clostridioides difficile P28]